MNEFIISKDTRERDFGWDPYIEAPVEIRTLKTGDYSVKGYEDRISIERKELNDLIGCLTKGRDRFIRELERARDLEYFAVLVEAHYSDLVHGNYVSRLHPNSAIESISAWEIRFGHPFLFCGNQELAARKCESLLKKFYREQMKQVGEIT
ncbi:MAG: ERCC4 domain-containing protein [Desulfomonilaceae bacterium]